jgi:shikimate kinase
MKIFLIGYMGSGKTTLGKILAEKLQLPFFDLDEEIEKAHAKSITRLFDEEGEEAFRRFEKDILNNIIQREPDFVMATGGGTPCYFKNLEVMKKNGLTIYLQVALKELVRRNLQAPELRPLLRGMNELELQSYINDHLRERLSYYKKANITLKANEIDPDRMVQEIRLLLHSR